MKITMRRAGRIALVALLRAERRRQQERELEAQMQADVQELVDVAESIIDRFISATDTAIEKMRKTGFISR